MKWLKRLLIGLALAIGFFVAFSYLLPGEANVARSITINAPPQKVFPLVNDLREFHKWSPWSKRDPDMTTVYEGAEVGKGQKMTWKSDKPDVGSGSQVITDSVENRSVKTALDFGDMGTATAAFALEPTGDATRVTWSFNTELGNNPVMRWMGLMFDSMIGKEYEEGLSNLKKMAESGN